MLLLKVVSCSSNAIPDIFFFFCIESGLNRVRRTTIPPILTSTDFDIPDFYQQSFNDERPICTDEIIEKKRIVLFATDKQLEVLFSSECNFSRWYT